MALLPDDDFHIFAQAGQGLPDGVDFRRVGEVDDAVDILRTGPEPACEFCRRDALRQHLVQQQNLGPGTGR